MTRLGVERTSRTPFRSPSMSSIGVSAPLPPHSQVAERPAERRPRGTGSSRWLLRVLVVGGLAGAAWLLTGAAAQAADRADGPSGSLLGSVVDSAASGGSAIDDLVGSDTTAPVHRVLKVATRPLEAAKPVRKHHLVPDVLDVPRRVLTQPIVDEVVRDPSVIPANAATDGVDDVLADVAGPDRGAPADDQQRPIAATISPVATLPEPVAGAARAEAQPQEPVVAPVPKVSRVVTAVHDDAPSVRPSAPHRTATAHAVIARPERASAEDNPGGGGPAAPLRLHLGDVSGTPATGSGSTRTEGGSAAFQPAAIASSTMACHRLPIACDVEVRRHDAETPTASPD
ncbi:hypothetical protein HH310_37165 [Actinoplanes sp. TBRC 11911]|uniref:hypothetical protein n=1 Tax=Actinoplanes sp. TBRC 11911 TaxID=2729386 RepID=UPI00145FA85D|nr:hypothetical protein [Actinoplanes sp. TBRC 11911]NMO56791.1 hypothetical protein [Actinoplanes sp. TBRC 11911]